MSLTNPLGSQQMMFWHLTWPSISTWCTKVCCARSRPKQQTMNSCHCWILPDEIEIDTPNKDHSSSLRIFVSAGFLLKSSSQQHVKVKLAAISAHCTECLSATAYVAKQGWHCRPFWACQLCHNCLLCVNVVVAVTVVALAFWLTVAGHLQSPWAKHQEVEDLVAKIASRLGLNPYMQMLTRKFIVCILLNHMKFQSLQRLSASASGVRGTRSFSASLLLCPILLQLIF